MGSMGGGLVFGDKTRARQWGVAGRGLGVKPVKSEGQDTSSLPIDVFYVRTQT